MDENQSPFKNTNDLKSETFHTMKEVTETVKNMNLQEETYKGKSYLKELVQDPIQKLNTIATSKENLHFKTAIFAMLLWTVVTLIHGIHIYSYSLGNIMKHWLSILEYTISPIVSVVILSLIIFVLNKENKKSLSTIITTMVTVKLPIILSSVIGLLSLLSTSAYKLTSPISGLLFVISTVGIFFAIKDLFGIENDTNKALKSFTIVMAIFYLADFLLSFIGLSI